ncbi:hypothetical protein [Faunimonas pinastri]|uniref:hypothetical protein n=1 Tax=Faunimonas pinastri TaxID=1855383 RepID=UPI000B80EC5D|nr:hypothetical protein [Faunimonas pinastri]
MAIFAALLATPALADTMPGVNDPSLRRRIELRCADRFPDSFELQVNCHKREAAALLELQQDDVDHPRSSNPTEPPRSVEDEMKKLDELLKNSFPSDH